MSIRLLTSTLLASALLCTIGGRLWAQAPVPLTDEAGQTQEEKKELPREAQLAAEEYLDVLRQLGIVLTDYNEYLRKIDTKDRKELAAKLKDLSRQLERGEYSADTKALSSALREYVTAIKIEEKQLSQEKLAEKEELARTLRSLRYELATISELVQTNVTEQLAEQAEYETAIKQYVVASLKEVRDAGFNVVVSPEIFDDSMTIWVRNDSSSDRYVVMMPHTPETPTPPKPPRVVVMPTQPPVAPRAFSSVKGLQKVNKANTTVGSSQARIEIILEAGDMQILGTSDDQITATLEVEVAGKTREIEKKTVSSISLSLSGNDRDGYSVTADFPIIEDPETRIIRTMLKVEVPDQNPIHVRNTFGQVGMDDLFKSIAVTGDHSSIAITDCEGDIDVVNSMGPVALSGVGGRMYVRNAYDQISLQDCSGKIVIENQYGQVTLRDNDGNVTLKNSGTISIRGHAGQLKVDNTNGVVDIADIDGDLTAFNTFQPLIVRAVSGDVRVENSNAMITLSDIQGKASATNRFGAIRASDLSGQLTLINENGSIDLTIDGALANRSSVSSLSGPVTLWIDENSDLLVQAETLEGTISSNFPIELSDHGERREARVVIGNGGPRLAVTGTNSSITINKQ
ncbi:hypothetical protein KQH82_08295 [bacterium]|nr:hypothetical protein [bacterium]